MASHRGSCARTLCPLHQAVSVRVMRAPREVRALEAGAWRRVPCGGACRVVAVIVRGRQPSAGRCAGRLSPAARAPRRGCSAPCAA
eukprot:scaffold6488_cov30-Phaeocystis_antarctica.AAC.1